MLTLTKCYQLFIDVETGQKAVSDLSEIDNASLKVIYQIFANHYDLLQLHTDLVRANRTDEELQRFLEDPMEVTIDRLETDPMSCNYSHEQNMYQLRILAFGDSWANVLVQRNLSKSEAALYWAYLLSSGEIKPTYPNEKSMWLDLAKVIDGSPDKLRKEATKYYSAHERQNIRDPINKIKKVFAILMLEGFFKAGQLANSDLQSINK